MNTKTKQVEMRTGRFTPDGGSALQKGADFLRAFTLGFDVDVNSLWQIELGCDIIVTTGRFIH
jgi:rRNA processing protein Krr1/Pno1